MLHRNVAGPLIASAVAGALALCVCPRTSAQSLQLPTDAQVEQARREVEETERRVLPRAAEAAAQDGSVLLRDPPPAPADVQIPDIAALTRQFKQKQEQQAVKEGQGIFIFVSLSMPLESLTRAARDAQRAGAVLIMRGLPYGFGGGNWKRSMEALKPMTDLGAAVQLHPALFTQYAVTSVPTVIVAAGSPACPVDAPCAITYGRVLGDVSLAYALDQLSPRQDAVGELARNALRRMGERG